MWTYKQSDGSLTNPQDVVVGNGYSGRGEGLNNGQMQEFPDVGPVPVGMWAIGEWFDDPGGKGPMVAHLTMLSPKTDRSGFMIHGDNSEMNHTASEGCIILSHTLRQMMQESGDALLRVIP